MTDTPLVDIKPTTISHDEFQDRVKADKNSKTSGTSRPRTSRPKAPLPPWRNGVISEWVENLYTSIGKMIEPFDEAYGKAFQAVAQPAGAAWENVARDLPWLRRLIHNLMTTTKLSELVLAHMPLILLVLHRHGPMAERIDDLRSRFDNEMNGSVA